jgi:hypothetical protein
LRKNSDSIIYVKNAGEPMNENKEPPPMKCPMCGRIKAMVDKGDGTYWCNHCKALVDPRDD